MLKFGAEDLFKETVGDDKALQVHITSSVCCESCDLCVGNGLG